MRDKTNWTLQQAVICTSMISLASTTILAQEHDDGTDQSKHQSSDRTFPRSFSHNDRKRLHNREITDDQYRSIDGYGNNIDQPDWGSSEIPFFRLYPADYSDGLSHPAGDNRKSARDISNIIATQTESILNSKGASDMLWQWGQFLDHDITEVPAHDPEEAFNISVPQGDPSFDPTGTGTQEIPLSRSFYAGEEGLDERQQINIISSFIDASNVYGSDEERAHALRTNDGTGMLKVTESEHGDLLPYNTDGIDNAGGTSDTLFIAGDVRANEQVGLTAMHTLFVREHNYWAERIGKKDSEASGEEIYQQARRIVAAEMQAITYNEFLPVLLGKKAIPKYNGYRDDVRPDLSNTFSTAVYRFGHSLLSPTLLRLDEYGEEITAGHLSLADAFFQPSHTAEEGIEVTLRGLVSQQCQELDELVISEVRDFLFGPPGAGGLDLVALNIQRGRDHGINDYNSVREIITGSPVADLSEISEDTTITAKLESAYEDINDMDLWIVGLSEDPHPRSKSMLGALLHDITVDQFVRLRDGDRFFYKNDLPPKLVRLVEKQTLATIIRRNTTIEEEIQDNVFLINQGSLINQDDDNSNKSNRNRNRRPHRRR